MLLVSKITTNIYLYLNNASFKRVVSRGIPYISVAKNGTLEIGTGFSMNNLLSSNPIGRNQRCILFVNRGAKLIIGNNVGISAAALVAHRQIVIEDNVKIGGGCCIYDTDFHALDDKNRREGHADQVNKISLPVHISRNAFLGAHCTILKGVTIGESAIIGACSVVTKDVPPNEIWAGNPAKFIKKISITS